MSTCPTDCIERHNSNAWAISKIISGLVAILMLYGGLWYYMTENFARASEVRELKGELRADIGKVSDKIDVLLQKVGK